MLLYCCIAQRWIISQKRANNLIFSYLCYIKRFYHSILYRSTYHPFAMNSILIAKSRNISLDSSLFYRTSKTGNSVRASLKNAGATESGTTIYRRPHLSCRIHHCSVLQPRLCLSQVQMEAPV
jgi:hypothetical protein